MQTTFLIAAPMSGSGKTTIARGLMALLASKGMKVQPFKCGPDYIDTKFHEAVCGRPSINLDTFMATPDHVRELFARYGADADACIVEGMMGLFDGYDRERGSSYEIARILDIPVLLVVDARSAAYSMAALLSGFLHFREDVRFAGVIFNKVGSPRHAERLRQVCDDLHVGCLGCLPKEPTLEQGSRYLGLDFSEKTDVEGLVRLLETHVHWEAIVKMDDGKWMMEDGRRMMDDGRGPSAPAKCSAVVARNAESFSFVYQETLDSFRTVSYFDPETEVPQLEGADVLYLPGGYPEKHLEALVANEACRRAISAFAERDGRIVAECGGMMYLCQRIVTDDGAYPMCGVLPLTVTARKADRKLSLGYRRFVLDGREFRGHEFHYTQFLPDHVNIPSPSHEALTAPRPPQSACQVYDAMGNPVATPVFKFKHVLASYTHLYLPMFSSF